MEELEKNQKVGEIITQAGQTTSSPRRIRSAASASAATRVSEDIDKGITKVTTQSEEAVSKIILKSIPSDSQITFVRFEGPNIALYTKNPKFALTELTYFLSSLSKTLKKRFIIRTDPSSRLPEDQT
ncbi:MAG TPA: beta-CASP ribonuclease aCPSF1, partial [Nitrososphaera sp.]|nr:beta-CASP ribonuclease aCPSF1 [Nitrososphaera sp.]